MASTTRCGPVGFPAHGNWGKRRSDRRRWHWVLARAAVLLALVLTPMTVAAPTPAWTMTPSSLDLSVGEPAPPDVTGMRLDLAVEELQASQWEPSLAYGYDGYQTIPDGVPSASRAVVVEQRAECREDPRYVEDICTFVLSVEAIVPDLRGLTSAAAGEELERSGLGLDVADSLPSDDRVVTDQAPAPGETLAFGEPVAVRLAAVELPGLPDLVGVTLRQATTRLADLARQRQEVDPNYSQQVTIDPDVRPVDDERAFVSEQPEDCAQPSRVCTITLLAAAQVPSVVGQSVAEAERTLAEAGLLLDPDSASDDRRLKVDTQSEEPGTFVPFDTTVSVGLEPVVQQDWPPLPAIQGMRLDRALGQLALTEERRAEMGEGYIQNVVVRPQADVSEDRAQVVEQPSDCARFAPECVIVLSVRALVPNLSGMTLPKARAELEAAGLALVTEPIGDAQEPLVNGQTPTAGSTADFGSAVTVRLTSAAGESSRTQDGANVGWIVGGGLVAVVAARATRVAARRHGRRWVREHVRAEAELGTATQQTFPDPTSGPSHAVRISAEPGVVQEWVEEVDRG